MENTLLGDLRNIIENKRAQSKIAMISNFTIHIQIAILKIYIRSNLAMSLC
jgi:hypothetical protein